MSSPAIEVSRLQSVFALRVRGVRLVLPSQAVAAVIGFDPPTRLPRTPPHIVGLLPYGDGALAIVDLAKFLELTEVGGADDGLSSRRVVVVRHEDLEAGLLCDQTHGVRSFNSAIVEPATVLRVGRLPEFVSWEFDESNARVGLLDVAAVLEKARVANPRNPR